MPARLSGRGPLRLAIALVVLLFTACGGTGGTTGTISVTDPWIRVTTPDQPAAGYLVIANGTPDDDALTAVSSPAFGSVQLHETMVMSAEPGDSGGGMMGMQPVSEIPVPANGSVSLEPGGYHLMLTEAIGAVAVGDLVELTLTFRNADPVTVSATVKGA
jgi:periplasmic copper chaperone A